MNATIAQYVKPLAMLGSGTKARTMIRKSLLALLRLFFNAVVAGTVGALIVGFTLQRAAEVGELRQEVSIALNRAAVLARDRSEPQVDLRSEVRERFEEGLDEDLFLLRGRLPDNLHGCLKRLVNRTRLRNERIVDLASWRRAFDEDSVQYTAWTKSWARRATLLPFFANPWEDRTCGFK